MTSALRITHKLSATRTSYVWPESEPWARQTSWLGKRNTITHQKFQDKKPKTVSFALPLAL